VESDRIRLAGGLNTFAYVHGNPLSRFDPFGLRDVIVAIWTSQVLQGQVGHVFLGEMDGTAITSQFPDPHGIEGINTTKTWIDTLASEGRPPDNIYEIYISDDGAFDAAAAAARNTPTWSAFPDGTNSTNCARAASGALSAGGVRVGDPSNYWPNYLNLQLMLDSLIDSNVYRLPAAPW